MALYLIEVTSKFCVASIANEPFNLKVENSLENDQENDEYRLQLGVVIYKLSSRSKYFGYRRKIY